MWQDEAACKDEDPEIFFPKSTNPGAANKAVMICFGCKVRAKCEQYQKDTGTTDGVWGGTLLKRGGK